jgi:hypothetical protein
MNTGFIKTVVGKLRSLWRSITDYNDSEKAKWGHWAKHTQMMYEALESPSISSSEERAMKYIRDTVLENVVWQLANIRNSQYNTEGIRLQLIAIRDFIEPPESTAAAAEKVGQNAEERENKKKKVEELLTELGDLFKYFTR